MSDKLFEEMDDILAGIQKQPKETSKPDADIAEFGDLLEALDDLEIPRGYKSVRKPSKSKEDVDTVRCS